MVYTYVLVTLSSLVLLIASSIETVISAPPMIEGLNNLFLLKLSFMSSVACVTLLCMAIIRAHKYTHHL